MNDDIRLVGIDEACERLGISRSTVEKLLKTSQFQQVRVGARRMIRLSSIVDFINRGGDR